MTIFRREKCYSFPFTTQNIGVGCSLYYLIFIFSCQNADCGYFNDRNEAVRKSYHNLYVLERNKKDNVYPFKPMHV